MTTSLVNFKVTSREADCAFAWRATCSHERRTHFLGIFGRFSSETSWVKVHPAYFTGKSAENAQIINREVFTVTTSLELSSKWYREIFTVTASLEMGKKMVQNSTVRSSR